MSLLLRPCVSGWRKWGSVWGASAPSRCLSSSWLCGWWWSVLSDQRSLSRSWTSSSQLVNTSEFVSWGLWSRRCTADPAYLIIFKMLNFYLFIFLLQAYFSPKPCHSNAGGGEAHSAGEHRDRSRGRGEEALKEDWLGQLLYFQFVLICSSTLVTVFCFKHGLVFVASLYSHLWTTRFCFHFNWPFKHISHRTGGGLKPSDWLNSICCFNSSPCESLQI